MQVLFGIDVLIQLNPEWKKQRLALVTNHAATTHTLQPTSVALLNAGFNLVQLFSPEHGLYVTGADGVAIPNEIDAQTQLPVISLYENILAPSTESLANIDIVLFDIPDCGARFYTYLWTMSYVMEACAQMNKQLIILDRPNPISGNLSLVQGPELNTSCTSFIGRWPIPIKHSCTLGELALYFKSLYLPNLSLEIIACKNWQRSMLQTNWNIPFVPTSPAIHSLNAMLLYPGLCFLEATNLTEGRGTEFAFETVGAPWLNTQEIYNKLVLHNLLQGITVKQIVFTPKHSKFAYQPCNGLHFSVIDHTIFKPVVWGILLLKIIIDTHSSQFEWKPYSTNVNPSGRNHLDKLLGLPNSERLFALSIDALKETSLKFVLDNKWATTITPFLLY